MLANFHSAPRGILITLSGKFRITAILVRFIRQFVLLTLVHRAVSNFGVILPLPSQISLCTATLRLCFVIDWAVTLGLLARSF